MFAALLTALLAFQGLPIAPLQFGTVSGVLRTVDGRPAFGVRVAALAKPESQTDALGGADLASLAQTDEEGRFRLENIPSGQYYIVAGRVDLPTYYPGTPQVNAATVVKIDGGTAQAGLDFSINDTSIRTAATDEFRTPRGRRPVQIRVVTEGSSKIPVHSAAGAVFLEFERAADGVVTTVPATFTSAVLEFLASTPVTPFRVSVSNLPEGYAVKSIMDGATDITKGTFKVPSTLSYAISATGAALATAVPPAPLQPLTVTLAASGNSANATGVRVSGIGSPGNTRPIYLSGNQGVIFSDGSFEFSNVPPGRHTIAAIDQPGKARGATIVVGTANLDNITLDDVSDLPGDIQTPRPPEPANGRPPGTKFAPVNVRVRLVEEKSKQPIAGREVQIGGRGSLPLTLDSEGRFAIQKLLPGVYSVEILIFGYSTVNQEITVGVEDLEVELTSLKMF